MVADPNRIVLTGENPFIRLSEKDGDPFSTNVSFWRIITSGGGPGHVIYIKSELTGPRWRIYSDNIAMARWLQRTVQGMLNPELKDLAIPVTEAVFSKSGDARDYWTETAETPDETLSLTWYELGEPMLIHTEPNVGPDARPYGVCSVLIPALGAQVTRNGVLAKGTPFARVRENRPFSNCALAFCESWTEPR
jgi:hypothetical protein